MKNNKRGEYSEFQTKIMQRFCVYAALSIAAVIIVYLFLWKQRGGDWTVRFLEHFMRISHEQAFFIYHTFFRSYKEIFFAAAIILIFTLLLWRLFQWMTGYFKEVNQGIDALLAEDVAKIHLSPEMKPFENKLNETDVKEAEAGDSVGRAEER